MRPWSAPPSTGQWIGCAPLGSDQAILQASACPCSLVSLLAGCSLIQHKKGKQVTICSAIFDGGGRRLEGD